MGHSADDAVHKIPRKMKIALISRISCKYQCWFNSKSSMELDKKKIDVIILVQCPLRKGKSIRGKMSFLLVFIAK